MVNTNSTIQVSIILVTYNQQDYIADSIKSALQQSYKNIQLIIADDNSADDTRTIIDSFREEINNRFIESSIIYNETNKGLTRNIINALGCAKGDWIKILYGDDILMPTCITDCINYICENPQCHMIHTDYYICKDDDRYEKVINAPGKVNKPKRTNVNTKDLFNNYFIVSPTVFIKKDAYESALDPEISIDDWGTYLEVSINHKIGYLDKSTVSFRILSNSMSHFSNDEKGHNKFIKMFSNEIMVMDKYKNNPLVDRNRGIKNCCEQAISIAIDLGFDDIISMAYKYAKNNDVRISVKYRLKKCLRDIGLLAYLQNIKRYLGMETGTVSER